MEDEKKQIPENNNNESNTNLDDYVKEEKHKNKENEVDLDELTPIKTGKIMTFGVNDITLNQERNVSSEDSNLSIDENKKIVEDKNIDDGFEEIVESDNEDNLAFESTSNTQKFNDSISNVEPELIINDVEKDNNSINNTNKENNNLFCEILCFLLGNVREPYFFAALKSPFLKAIFISWKFWYLSHISSEYGNFSGNNSPK